MRLRRCPHAPRDLLSPGELLGLMRCGLMRCGRASAHGLRAVASVTAVAAVAAVVGGCGGNGRLSHDEFVKRADAICSAYRGSTQRLAHPRSYGQVLAYVKKTLPVYEAALRKLEQLKPPQSDAAIVRKWLAADRRIVKAEQELALAAQRHDFDAVTAAANAVQQAGVDARHAAADLGMQVCARA
jgi:hypothetical protein